MPISGVVIASLPSETNDVLRFLATLSQVEVHGADEKGNIVAVLETESSDEMEKIIDRISRDQNVLHVGLTYLNAEDEAERIIQGEEPARPFGFRKPSGTT
ncbi:glutamate synthase [Desulfopila sp. IMCC35006]|uniref:chaperone NapD n=1 Tax=Desulfopila sp. IMCC35006 TaxID=2569542 RepID=UPI0010AB8ED8|nr:chaperone NapD [Desulfopila sp. IMCC35006]TKB24142.1 glutamate synthase [Desulfopila sp. IMCC35006]